MLTNEVTIGLARLKEIYITNITREIALMIQLEQQQHREFWVGWWGGVGHIPTTYIQLAGAGSIKKH